MSEHKGISIIIPCYNSGQYLREAVESIYAQKLTRPFEIIIVDDGSTALSTHQALQNIEENFPDIQIACHNKNMGVASARNTALRMASYPYVFPLDSDDMLSSDPELLGKKGGYLDRSIKMLEENPDIVMTICNFSRFGNVPKPFARYRKDHGEKHLLYSHNIGCFAVYRHEEALAIGGYNEKLRHSVDWDFNIAMFNGRLKENRKALIHRMQEPFYLYRSRHDQSNLSSNAGMPRKKIIAHIIERSPEIYQKYFPEFKGQALVGLIHQSHQKAGRHMGLNILFDCMVHPRRALKDGSAAFITLKIKNKLRHTWQKIMPEAAQAETAPIHQEIQ